MSIISSNVSDQTLRLTAVGLVTGFVQMALGGPLWSEELRSKALKELPIWKTDESEILKNLASTPEAFDCSVSPNSPFEEPDNCTSPTSPPTSPAVTRAGAKRKIKPKAEKREPKAKKRKKDVPRLPEDDESSGGQSRTRPATTRSSDIQSAPNPGTEENERKDSSNSRGQKRAAADMLQISMDLEANRARPDRPYCTQACLLGLIRGHFFDKKCPNIQAHQKSARDYSRNTKQKSQQRKNRHAINQPTLARPLDEQLQRAEREDNGGIKSLNRSGWAGALFRLELLSHGYTFVGKGTCGFTSSPGHPTLYTSVLLGWMVIDDVLIQVLWG